MQRFISGVSFVLKLRNNTPVLSKIKVTGGHNLKRIRFFHPKFLSTSAVNSAKLYRDTENLYAYSVLQSIPVVNSAICAQKPPKKIITSHDDFTNFLSRNWRTATASEIVQAFGDVTAFCASSGIPLSDPRFDGLVDGLMDHVENLTDAELSDLMQLLIRLPQCASYDSHNFHDVWSALDDTCLARLADWPYETRFRFADLWYRLNLGRICDYNFAFTDRLAKWAGRRGRPREYLVHAFFYLNVSRKRKVEFEVEHALEGVIGEMSADEMGVVAMGYFKTESKIKPLSIVEAMCRKVMEEHGTIHEISLAAILKALRLANHVKSGEMLYAVLDSLVPEIQRLSNVTCVHVALLGTNLQVYHAECLSRIVEKVSGALEEPGKVRLKEIERLLLATTMFGFESPEVPDFYGRCLRQLKKEERRAERAKHPRCVPCALNFLGIRGLYDHELMSEILDEDYITQVYGRSGLPREQMVLDYSIEIECPDYKGNRLASRNRNKTVKFTSEHIPHPDNPKQTAANQLFLNVQSAVHGLTGDPELSSALHILPHFAKADIVLCKDLTTNEFIAPRFSKKYTLTDVKYPDLKENLKWYALIVLSYNHTIREQPTPLGAMKMKARQLKVLGFVPIFVAWCDIQPKSHEERVDFLRKLLN